MKKILSIMALLLTSSVAFAQDDSAGGGAGVDVILYLTYALVFVAAIAAIVFPIIRSNGDKASLKRSLFTFLGVVVIFIIGYIMASSEVTPLYEKFGVTGGESKRVGAALYTTYIMTIITAILLALIFIKGIFDWVSSLSSK